MQIILELSKSNEKLEVPVWQQAFNLLNVEQHAHHTDSLLAYAEGATSVAAAAVAGQGSFVCHVLPMALSLPNPLKAFVCFWCSMLHTSRASTMTAQ